MLPEHLHFVRKEHHGFLVLLSTRNHFSTQLVVGAVILISKAPRHKPTSVKGMAVRRPQKGHGFTVRGPKAGGRCCLSHLVRRSAARTGSGTQVDFRGWTRLQKQNPPITRSRLHSECLALAETGPDLHPESPTSGIGSGIWPGPRCSCCQREQTHSGYFQGLW